MVFKHFIFFFFLTKLNYLDWVDKQQRLEKEPPAYSNINFHALSHAESRWEKKSQFHWSTGNFKTEFRMSLDYFYESAWVLCWIVDSLHKVILGNNQVLYWQSLVKNNVSCQIYMQYSQKSYYLQIIYIHFFLLIHKIAKKKNKSQKFWLAMFTPTVNSGRIRM